MKKYIVDNLADQTIGGNLKVNGSLVVSPDGTYSIGTYRALLTHAGTFSGNNIADFNYALIVGETYTITNYVGDDDFSNIANVQSGNINETDCVFIATGELPSSWGYGSTLQSSGNLVVDVIENDLGYGIEWSTAMGEGVYIGTKIYDGYYNGGLFNDWPRTTTSAIISQSIQILYGLPPIGPVTQFAGPARLTTKDDCIVVANWNYDTYAGANYWLYCTPIEIKTRKNINTEPVVIAGTMASSFPFSYVAFDFIDQGSIFTDSIYTDDSTVVNDMPELVDMLNSNINTSFFGTYADDGNGGVSLTMPTNLRDQFSPSGNLTFIIFAN